MSGNDTMYAQRKYGQPFSFKPWALNIFSTNRMWSSSDTTDGYLRRWLPIPFTVRLEEDPDFNEATLHAEYAGIFNKAMEALRTLMARGKFERSHEANLLLAEFTEASDGIIQFLNDGDFIEKHDPKDDTYSTPKSDVYEAYVRYTGGKGLGREKFYNSLQEKGFRIGTGGRRAISGIRLTPADIPSWTAGNF
jgi:phage/plasmid-associated DNA primase